MDCWRWGRRGVLAALAAVAMTSSGAAQAPSARSETYSDWVVRCQVGDDEVQRCWMMQTLSRESGNERVLQLELAVADGTTRMSLLAPFGLDLSEGAQLMVDEEAVAALDFHTCLPAGCLVQEDASEALLGALRRGQQLTVGFTVAQGGQPLRLTMSLAGFSAAHNRLRALQDGTE